MKRILLGICAGLMAMATVLAVAAPASAADLARPAYRGPAYKAPYFVAPFSWTGFYVGINGGYAWGTSDWTGTGSFDTKGGLVGGTVGYNLQTGVWVWGLEGDFDASWIKGTETAVCGVPGCETNNQWFATARGRIGYAWDRFLPFVTGGAAFGAIKMTPGLPPTATDTQVGWTVGGGVEWAFSGNWSAKAEYLYADLGKANCDAATCGISTDVSFKANIVRVGVNYRFW
jgi:outer membrane immunogenic protein